jgi:hypothetical protein
MQAARSRRHAHVAGPSLQRPADRSRSALTQIIDWALRIKNEIARIVRIRIHQRNRIKDIHLTADEMTRARICD